MAATSTTTTRSGPPTERGGGSFERVTVNLTEKTSQALAEAVRLSGDSKTDSINKAIQMYRLLLSVQDQGGGIYLRESAEAEQERLRVL